VFSTVLSNVDEALLKKIYSVMADTTSMNTGKDRGINSRLAVYFDQKIGHGLHILECQFHVNEILLAHVVKYLEGKPTAPDRMEQDSVYNMIKSLKPGQASDLVHCNDLVTTSRAVMILKSALEWFSEVEG